MSRSIVPLMLVLLSGCAASRSLRAELPPLQLEAPQPPPQILTENHFSRDRASSISETELKTILAAPVFLEERSRVGVVPVAGRYELDGEVPTLSVPGVLAETLEGSGLFEAASEVSTDWPSDRGISGLRELAARYRTEYLVLYRQRFVEHSHANRWALGYATLVGTLFLPGQTLETAGVLEATVFDVKTGTILFTVFERVEGSSQENPWATERKLTALKRRLLTAASQRLADQVVHKCRRLAAARPPLLQQEQLAEGAIAPLR